MGANTADIQLNCRGWVVGASPASAIAPRRYNYRVPSAERFGKCTISARKRYAAQAHAQAHAQRVRGTQEAAQVAAHGRAYPSS